MKAYELVQLVKKHQNIESDYAAAQMLGITRSALSAMRNGHTTYVAEETALKAAELTGMDGDAVVLDQLVERVKSPSLREAIQNRVRQVCILC